MAQLGSRHWHPSGPPAAKLSSSCHRAARPCLAAHQPIADRQCCPQDEKYDLELPLWAGVIPLRQDVPQPAIDAEDLPKGIPVPQYVQQFDRKAKALAQA